MQQFKFDKQKGAIPEAKSTKRQLLEKKERAQRSISHFNQNRYLDDFQFMANSIVELYLSMQPHLLELEMNDSKNYSSLHDLQNKPEPVEDYKQIEQEDIEYYREKFVELSQALYDLGVTKISLEKQSKPYGFEFLKGLDHTLGKREDPGWARLKKNLLNMRRLLRKDTDLVGVIYGGNRTGKTTLSLQCTRILQKGKEEGKLNEEQYIIQSEDFRKAMDEGEQYQANHIDEMSLLFHKRDGMNTEQKNRNKMMKTYAVKNMAMIGCDNNFYNIDQEFLSDKVDFAIHVPKRGKFEFYSKSKVAKFKKSDDNTPKTPNPDFTGRFPDLDPDNGKTDPLWKQYKEIEHKKLEVEDDEQEEGAEMKKAINQVVETPGDYKKELEGRDPIISHRLIRAEYPHLSVEQAKTVKDAVEAKVDLS